MMVIYSPQGQGGVIFTGMGGQFVRNKQFGQDAKEEYYSRPHTGNVL